MHAHTHAHAHTLMHTHTQTHNHFTAVLDFVWDYPGEPAPERKNQSGFTGARYSEWQCHQLGHKQICTLTQTQPRQHPTTQFFTGWMLFLPPNQQRLSTEGISRILLHNYKNNNGFQFPFVILHALKQQISKLYMQILCTDARQHIDINQLPVIHGLWCLDGHMVGWTATEITVLALCQMIKVPVNRLFSCVAAAAEWASELPY